MPSTSEELATTTFRTPLRLGVAIVLILIGLGQITGRILSINSINMLSTEQSLRNDLQSELRYLIAVAIEEGNADDQAIYERALLEEFQEDSSKLVQEESARNAAKVAKERAGKKWPIQSRRDNWDSRRKEIATDALIKKVISETKFRREDLLAELKYLAVLAHEANETAEVRHYLDAIPTVARMIGEEARVSQATSEPPSTAEPAAEENVFEEKQLDAPEVVAAIKRAKEEATHHWPIALRKQDSERIRNDYGTQRIVDLVRLEVNKQRPFLSGNDRSRWLTVRSLVEFGTFEVNDILEYEPNWDSVDIVSHMNSRGEQKLYSSKPPLQAMLVAAPYWGIHKITGWTFRDRPFEVGRILLIVVCVLPLGFGWWCCARILDAWCDEDLTFVIVLASICFATLLTTFGVAFNNHLWGAVSAAATSLYAMRCWQGSTRVLDFVATGFWAAFTFTSELPAASFVAMFGFLLLLKAPRLTLLAGTPAVLLVLLAYFGTNYMAHGKWKPPYSFGAGDVNTVDSKSRENWYDYDFVRYFDGRKVDSYWRNPNNPLDLGEPNLGKYVFHATLGHHGIFSLTPLLLLAIPGLALTCMSSRQDQRLWGIGVLVVSVVCMVFYLFMLDVRQRNYGGTTSAFRQLLWLHPLWLIGAAPVVDRLTKHRAGIVVIGLLALFSMISVAYPHWNPWSQTWIWNGMIWLGGSPLSG